MTIHTELPWERGKTRHEQNMLILRTARDHALARGDHRRADAHQESIDFFERVDGEKEN